MNSDIGGKLLDYFEEFLGARESSWKWQTDDGVQFYVFKYRCPFNANAYALVTCGLSAHQFSIVGDSKVVNREFLICADEETNMKAIAALLIAVGAEALDAHVVNPISSVLEGGRPLVTSGNAEFEYLYVSTPLGFDGGFGVCDKTSPSIEIAQLIPITNRERLFFAAEGGPALENRLMADLINLLRFDRRNELV